MVFSRINKEALNEIAFPNKGSGVFQAIPTQTLGGTCCTLEEALKHQGDDFMMLLLVVFMLLSHCLLLTNEIISVTRVRYSPVYMMSWALSFQCRLHKYLILQVHRVTKNISTHAPNSRGNATAF